jgi:hypothetical protein
MRNLLALIGLVVVGFAAIGWYCGWYKLTVLKGTDGKPEIRTTVNTDKVTEDSSAFFQRMEQLVNQKVHPDDPKSPQPAVTPGNTPGPITPVKGAVPETPSFVPGKPPAPTGSGSR